MRIRPLLQWIEASRNLSEVKPGLQSQEAKVESTRCLYCFDAPCIHACPTGIDIPSFIKKIASGRPVGAARTILDANVLGGSCARVCPTEELCEGACVLLDRDQQPIQIGRLQRFATDTAIDRGAEILKPAPESSGKRVALIGSGPASLACAAELRRLGHDAVVFEKKQHAGGLNTHGIAYYKMPPKVSLDEVAQIEAMGVEIRRGVEVGVDVSIDSLRNEFDALFIGIGLGGTHQLGIPGEQLPEAIAAVDFIERIHMLQFDQVPVGRRVVVLGGGNTAIDAATQARRLGAEKVTIVYRRGPEQMSAYPHEVEHAKQDGVEFHFFAQPIEIMGDDHVTGLRTEVTRLDADGRCEAVPGFGIQFDADMVLLAVGQGKQKELLNGWFPELNLGRSATVACDLLTGETNLPGVYTGGDCANGGKEVVNAVAEGRRAALAMHTQFTEETVEPLVQTTRSGAPSGATGAGFDRPIRVRQLEKTYYEQHPDELPDELLRGAQEDPNHG